MHLLLYSFHNTNYELLVVSSGSGPLFRIGTDEMELGLGVHGEAGIKRVKV
jgi:dihydroxyacetone kinase